MSKNQMDIQLKETSQLTGAYWAIWLEHTSDWEILASYKLKAQNRSVLMHLIQTTTVKGWVNGALSGSRRRSRPIPHSSGLPGSKVYVFPDQMTQRVILVGAAVLSNVAQRFWRVVALGNSNRSFLDPSSSPALSIPDLGTPYFLPEVLNRVLGLSLQTAESEVGWLAIRSGDFLEIKACKNCEGCSGVRISIDANPLLREISNKLQGRLVEQDDVEWAMVPRIGFSELGKNWAALPLVIGQRLIGLVVFWRTLPISHNEWQGLQQLAIRVSPSVEASITFSDLTEHLGRMALLNDFAVTITSALDPEQIAQRMFALLQRAFGTERINLVVLSLDGNSTQNYVHRDGTIVLQTMSAEECNSSQSEGEKRGSQGGFNHARVGLCTSLSWLSFGIGNSHELPAAVNRDIGIRKYRGGSVYCL